jgi:hypothetical protein
MSFSTGLRHAIENEYAKSRTTAAYFVILLVILTMPSASSPQDINLASRGFIAQAYFVSESTNGCESAFIYLDAATNTPVDGFSREGAPNDALQFELPALSMSSSTFSLFITKQDRCTGESHTFYGGDLAPEFSWDANLDRATIRGQATMSEVSRDQSALTRFNLFVDLVWTAVADSIQVQDAEHYPLRDLMVTSVNEGVRRPALAAGRITDGVRDLVRGSSAAVHTGFLNVHNLFIGCASLKCHPPPSS